ncbi:MAG: PaaI family thioesterase [Kordiimonadaceae bacterium]|nr:PaaI family thioesterase [Kordiimonadaceae bacterium]
MDPAFIFGTESPHALFSLFKLGDLKVGDNAVSGRLPFQQQFTGASPNRLARGWTTVVTDTLLGLAVFTRLKKARPIATVDLTIDFVAPPSEGADILCSAVCDEITGGIAFMSGELVDAVTGSRVANVSSKFVIKEALGEKKTSLNTGSEKNRNAKQDREILPPPTMPEGVPCQELEKLKTDNAYLKWLNPTSYSNERDGIVALEFQETYIGDPIVRAIHGGILANLLEVTASRAAALEQPEGFSHGKLLSQSVQYLRSTSALHSFATARVVRNGARLTTVDAIVWQHDKTKPAARGTFIFSNM